MPKFQKNPSPFMKKSPMKDFWPWSKTEKGELKGRDGDVVGTYKTKTTTNPFTGAYTVKEKQKDSEGVVRIQKTKYTKEGKVKSQVRKKKGGGPIMNYKKGYYGA